MSNTTIPPNDAPLLEILNGKFTGRLDSRWRLYLIGRDAAAAGGDEFMVSVPANAVAGTAAAVDEAQLRALPARNGGQNSDDAAIIGNIARSVVSDILDSLAVLAAPRGSSPAFYPIADTLANQGNYPAKQFYPGYFIATDTRILYRSDGATWVQVNPWDDAYGGGWNASLKAPTQNAIYQEMNGVVFPAINAKADAQAPGGPHSVPLAKITVLGADGVLTFNSQGVITGFTDPT